MAKKGWIKLKTLRPGAVFETKEGKKYFKAADEEKDRPFIFSLESGFCSLLPSGKDEFVSEITVNPLGYYWVGFMLGSMRAAELSDEDREKLTKLTEKFIKGLKL